MKTKTTMLLALLALGTSGFIVNAQDNNPPPGGTPGADSQPPALREGGGPVGPRGFHLLPPRAEQRLNLTDDQKKQIAALEAETKAKLEKILTPDQMEKLKNMRPPMMGRGGPGMRGGPGGPDNMPPNGPPPGGNDGNTPPPGPASGRQLNFRSCERQGGGLAKIRV